MRKDGRAVKNRSGYWAVGNRFSGRGGDSGRGGRRLRLCYQMKFWRHAADFKEVRLEIEFGSRAARRCHVIAGDLSEVSLSRHLHRVSSSIHTDAAIVVIEHRSLARVSSPE